MKLFNNNYDCDYLVLTYTDAAVLYLDDEGNAVVGHDLTNIDMGSLMIMGGNYGYIKGL